MKRVLTIMLAVCLIFQTGAFAAFGKCYDNERRIITISDIDTSQLTGESAESSTVIESEGLPADSLEIVSEEWTGPAEYVISGRNITIKGGKYSYRLVIRSDRTLTFDNDLEIYYQGINGRYKLHYDIDETDNHTMIVTGVFDNIIVSSPLLDKISDRDRDWILTHISEDSYFYQLILKTKEGFSFVNALRFLIDAHRCGFSVNYKFDLLTNRQTLVICGIPCCDQEEAEPDEPDRAGTVQEPAEPDEPVIPDNPTSEGRTDTAAAEQTVAPAVSEILDLPAVKISRPKAARNKINVKWKKPSGKDLKKVSGVEMQLATDAGFTNIVKTATAGKKKTSKLIKGLQPKTRYYVRIRTYAAGNHVSDWKTRTVTTK